MTTREQLIEAIGKPIHDMRFNGDRYATIEIIMEVLTAIEATGLCIVPVEATEAMLDAGFLRNAALGGAKRSPGETYRAMIDTGKL